MREFIDSYFQSDLDDQKLASGYVFLLNCRAICWRSTKQGSTTDSITEAEYIVASDAAKEAVWIQKFMTKLGVVSSTGDHIPLYCDNNGTIAQAKEPHAHQKSKHVE